MTLVFTACGQNAKKQSTEMKTLVAYFSATSGGSSLRTANREFKAAYPTLNWKDGKVLNGASKATLSSWVESLK